METIQKFSQLWNTGDLITAEKMNKIYTTINSIIDPLNSLEEQISQLHSDMEEHNTVIEEDEEGLGLKIIYKS